MNENEIFAFLAVLAICTIILGVITWLITTREGTPTETEVPGWVDGTAADCLTYNFSYNFLTENSQATYNSVVLDNLSGTATSCYDSDMISAQLIPRTCTGLTGNICTDSEGNLVSYNGSGSYYSSCSTPCDGEMTSLFFGYTEDSTDNYLSSSLEMENSDYYQFRVSYTGTNGLLTRVEDRTTGMCLDISTTLTNLTLDNMGNFPECSGLTSTIQGYGLTLTSCTNGGWNWYSVPSLNVTGPTSTVNHQQLVYVKGLSPPSSLDLNLLTYLDSNAGAVYTDQGTGTVPIVASRQNGCYSNYAMYQPFTFTNRNSYGLQTCDYPAGITGNCAKLP